MRIPVGKPLPPKARAAHSVKRGYDVLLDADGNAAKPKDPHGIWKRVINKGYDDDNDVMKLTFIDKTTLITRWNDTLYSCRVEDPEADMRKAREDEATELAAKFDADFSSLSPEKQREVLAIMKEMEKR